MHLLKGFIYIRSILYYSLGNLIALFKYDKKYLKGKYFQGRWGGVFTIGWEWVVKDFWNSLFKCSINRSNPPWPAAQEVFIGNWRNIEFDVDDLHIFHTYGTYFQALDGKIKIGKGSWIAPNVGIITSNHNLIDPGLRLKGKDVVIGEKSWIGMNSMILPGVVLGPHTIVGAGSVVTKSFPEGNCVIAGNPAKKIRNII